MVIYKRNIKETIKRKLVCEKCGCPLFKEEIMCPDCLTPVK